MVPSPSMAARTTAVKLSPPAASHRETKERTIPSPTSSGSSWVIAAARSTRSVFSPAMDSMMALAKSVARLGK